MVEITRNSYPSLSSQGDIVALKSEHLTVTTNNIVTYGGSIYLFSAGNVISQNLISNGGAIDVISSQGSVTTGYLRSDKKYNSGGKIYLQAAGKIKVIGSVFINPNHGLYATYITGSIGDYLVLTKRGSYAFYDGLVKSNGAIVTPHGFEPIGSVAEVKTQHQWLSKKLLPTSKYYDPTPMTQREQGRFAKIALQLNIYSRVALECGLKFFISFDNGQAGRAGRELFEIRTPLVTERSIKVHFVPPKKGLYPKK